jgi:hypothetical protein
MLPFSRDHILDAMKLFHEECGVAAKILAVRPAVFREIRRQIRTSGCGWSENLPMELCGLKVRVVAQPPEAKTYGGENDWWLEAE